MTNGLTPPGPPLEPPPGGWEPYRPTPHVPLVHAPAVYVHRAQDTGRASWALGLSLVPCCLAQVISVVLAVVTLTKDDDRVDVGKKRAVAALVICAVWTVVGVVVGVVQAINEEIDPEDRTSSERRDLSPDTRFDSWVLVADLEVGDCIRTVPRSGRIERVRLVRCQYPHEGEVYAEHVLDPGAWPGREEVVRLAGAGCQERLAGIAASEQRGLGVFYVYPTSKRSYAFDRWVTCIAEWAKPRTGHLRDGGVGA